MNNLTLAVCMYNAEQYIQKTLQSVIDQSFQDFDLLIVDDKSTDRSAEIAEAFLEKTGRQHEIVKLEQNQGICHARHFAERHAQTKYMMFLDADDILLENAVEKLYAKITSDGDLMAVGCYLDYMDKNGKKIGGGLYLGETTKESFIAKASKAKLIFMQPTAIYEREQSLRVGGYEIDGFPDGKPRWRDYCEDLDLWTRMSDLYAEGKAIIVVPEVLCHYRKSTGLSSNSFNMMLKMKYTKSNLKRRRRGESNQTFVEFYNSIPETEMAKIKKEASSADNLRNGAFLLKEKKIISGTKLVLKSIVQNPSYFVDKIKHNLIR